MFCLFVCLFCLFVCLFVCLFCLLVCLFVYLFVCLFVCSTSAHRTEAANIPEAKSTSIPRRAVQVLFCFVVQISDPALQHADQQWRGSTHHQHGWAGNRDGEEISSDASARQSLGVALLWLQWRPPRCDGRRQRLHLL